VGAEDTNIFEKFFYSFLSAYHETTFGRYYLSKFQIIIVFFHWTLM